MYREVTSLTQMHLELMGMLGMLPDPMSRQWWMENRWGFARPEGLILSSNRFDSFDLEDGMKTYLFQQMSMGRLGWTGNISLNLAFMLTTQRILLMMKNKNLTLTMI